MAQSVPPPQIVTMLGKAMAVFDGGSWGLTPRKRQLTLLERSAEPLWGVDSNPPKNSLFHFRAKPVYLCTTIRRLRLYRDRRDLI